MSDGLVRGYRQFGWDVASGGWLKGYYNAVWLNSELHAVCMMDDEGYEDEELPSSLEAGRKQVRDHIKIGDCNCGIFGTWDPGYGNDIITAICVFAGLAEQGSDGLRAEYARIEELWAPRKLAAEVQQKYPDVKVHAGKISVTAPVFSRTDGEFKVKKTFPRQQPVQRFAQNQWVAPTPPTQAAVNGQIKRAITNRPRRMLTKKYRCLKLLELTALPLDKPTISILIGQKALPSHKRYFTGMSEFMTGLVSERVIKHSKLRTKGGNPMWEITSKGRRWLKHVERDQEDRYLSIHLQNCPCGRHTTFANRARTQRTGDLISPATRGYREYLKKHGK